MVLFELMRSSQHRRSNKWATLDVADAMKSHETPDKEFISTKTSLGIPARRFPPGSCGFMYIQRRSKRQSASATR